MVYNTQVIFSFRSSLEDEALAAIPGLPLILEGYYGPRVWTWFSESARAETAGYEWRPDVGLVEQNASFATTDLAGWEELDDEPDEETPNNTTIHGFNIVSAPSQNQFNDNGTITTRMLNKTASNALEHHSTQDTTSTLTESQNTQSQISILQRLPTNPLIAQQAQDILDLLQSTQEATSVSTETTRSVMFADPQSTTVPMDVDGNNPDV